MNWANLSLLARHFFRNATKRRTFYFVYLIFVLLTAYAAVSGIQNHSIQNDIRKSHQVKARQSWEANPDKHPHRMAHFGTFAFRISPALGMFDYGLESFIGNTVFLEAHRQNSINFSEATFSTGTLRFGELSLSLLLQLIVPLILFFIGFSSVAADKQNGTLKILLSQGATWKEILFGKSIGLFSISMLFFIPIFLIVIISLLIFGNQEVNDFQWFRLFVIGLSYIAFLFVISAITIVVSTNSTSPKNSLLSLLGIWLLFVVLLPKSTQAMGNYWFPTPSKLAFQSAIEKEEIQIGDSHNPADPHYNSLRDSVLSVHNVSKVTDLPFNYAGFVMREGEKITTTLYNKHHTDLITIYKNQNNVTRFSSYQPICSYQTIIYDSRWDRFFFLYRFSNTSR
jgi:ABC-2 type transport system permease protein